MSASEAVTSQGVTPVGVGAGGEDEDTFERDLKEMLREGPSLNDLSSTVQGGGGGKPQAYIKPDTTTGIPRSHSVPPGQFYLKLIVPFWALRSHVCVVIVVVGAPRGSVQRRGLVITFMGALGLYDKAYLLSTKLPAGGPTLPPHIWGILGPATRPSQMKFRRNYTAEVLSFLEVHYNFIFAGRSIYVSEELKQEQMAVGKRLVKLKFQEETLEN